MALPFLPGNVFNTKIGKEKFHKSHYFDKSMGAVNFYYDNKPGIGGEPLPGQRIDPPKSRYPDGHGSSAPAWITFDKQVLCFEAYFQQAVHESRDEQYRVRRCQVLFYLEDDTIQVTEPRIQNSALPQGTIVRRHRIRKPPPYEGCFYTVDDFNVGMDLELYGRVYRLVSCDKFTANFLRKLGVRVNEPEPIPDDPYTIHRISVSDAMQPRRPHERVDTLRQFLNHDRHVLRFFCTWDDTGSLYGDVRDFVLNYFLGDDTIEIHERISANSGRESVPYFLRRQKLPKGVPPLPLPGTVSNLTTLNTLGTVQTGSRHMLDSIKLGTQQPEYYTDADLTLGAVLNVFGRKFLICDCDEFTKEFYRKKYGVKTFTPVCPPRNECGYTVKRENPPYNGWGSDEDSLANCYNLIPRPPKKTFEESCSVDVLRFAAHLIAGVDDDGICGNVEVTRRRIFVISCFLRDNTFMVYEPPVANSGFKGGKFMERRKVMKPGQPIFRTHLPSYYAPSDIYIGGQVVFNNFVFEIYGADEHTLAHMEAHPAEFPYADAQGVLRRLRPLVEGREETIRRLATEADPSGSGSIDFAEFGCLVREMLKDPSVESVYVVPHEVVTLARHYALKVPKETNYMAVVGMAQQQLRKVSFEAFQEILDACRYEDLENTGSIDRAVLRRICKANHLPLPDDILLTLMEISQNYDNGMVYYESFINQLNWCCNPVPPGTVPCEYSGNLEVDWPAFMKAGKDEGKRGGCISAFDSFSGGRITGVNKNTLTLT
ncbi:EF-hand domain-containing family member C2 [Echinococcus granulosus]|nr:EF-hand domain-containing family member C2 [Echinococcus granulosus]